MNPRRSRLFVKAQLPTQRPHTRAVCRRVVDGFQSPRLRIAHVLPEVADFAIEYDGCQSGLTLVLLVLIPLGADLDASFRLSPLCALCSDPKSCENSGDELLRSCHPWIGAMLTDSTDFLAGPDAGPG